MYQVAEYKPSEYNVLKNTFSIFNYYIYIENLEAERRRQEKAARKANKQTYGKNK